MIIIKIFQDCDYRQCWYCDGILKKPRSIDESCHFIKKMIDGYKKVCFIGISSGGYAAILFGSLLNVDVVLTFCPQTNLNLLVENDLIGHHDVPIKNIHHEYMDLNNVINSNTQYNLLYSSNITCGYHSSEQSLNINKYNNVYVVDNDRVPNYKMMIKIKELNKIFYKYLMDT